MNQLNHGTMGALVAILLAATAGCSVLTPQKDASRFFMLTAVTDGGASSSSAARSSHQFSVGVGPVEFPGYLKRPEIITRVSSDQVKLSEDKRWAEPVDSNFQAVLGQDLAQMLETPQVVMFPWYGTAHVDYQVEVQVIRFDASSDGQSVLTARWVIKGGTKRDVLYATETTVSSPVAADDAAATAALSRDVSLLSRQIADRISRLIIAS
jgi:uncharacterized protein